MAKNDEDTYKPDLAIGELFGFSHSRRVFTLDGDGGIISRDLRWPEEPYSPMPARTPSQHKLPLVSGRNEGFTLPLGLTVVSGRTSAGKSTFLRMLEKSAGLRIYRAVEPFDNPEEVIGDVYSTADGALAAALQEHRRAQKAGKKPSLIGLDSLRAPLFETSGPAGSKGVIMPFFTALTRVSNQLAKCGMTAIATVNPMNEELDFVESFLSKLSASVPCFVDIQSVTRDGLGVATGISGRVITRPKRDPVAFTLVPGSDVRVVEPSGFVMPVVPAARDVGHTGVTIVDSFK